MLNMSKKFESHSHLSIGMLDGCKTELRSTFANSNTESEFLFSNWHAKY